MGDASRGVGPVAKWASLLGVRLFLDLPIAALLVWLHFHRPGDGGANAAVVNAAMFLGFGVLHSIMARDLVKRRLARFTGEAGARIAFVVIAGLTLTLLWLHWQPLEGELWRLEGAAAWVVTALYLAAIAATLVSAQYIDLPEFLGVRPLWRARRGDSARPAVLSVRGPYAYSRHPMYALFIAAMWIAPVMTWSRLEFVALATLYFVIAVPLEERNLRAELGPVYDDYRANVPMWIPRRTPWRPAPDPISDATARGTVVDRSEHGSPRASTQNAPASRSSGAST